MKHVTYPQDSGGQRVLLLVASLMLWTAPQAAPTAVQAPVTAKAPKYYQQPTGFGGHQWDDPLLSFDRLPTGTPSSVEVARDSARFEEDQELIRCTGMSGDSCDLSSTLARKRRVLGEPKFNLMMTFINDDQAFRVAGDFMLHPVTHFFCLSWLDSASRPKPPRDVARHLEYCGVRLEFTSETPEQLDARPAEYVANYEHLLRYVVLRYGPPLHYKGRVIVVDAEQAARGEPGLRKFPRRYRWCTELDSIMAPKCDVNMVLNFDPATGKGALIMATPELQEFARTQRGPALGKPGPLFNEIFESW
ncbi:MAG TPA: hypothetical protein VIT67_11130 [Povalibacter sp.]